MMIPADDHTQPVVEKDNAMLFYDLLDFAIAHGYSLMGHASGERNSHRWHFDGFYVNDRCKVKVIRKDTTGMKPAQEHIYSVEEIMFGNNLLFLKAVCGASSYKQVAQQLVAEAPSGWFKVIEEYKRKD